MKKSAIEKSHDIETVAGNTSWHFTAKLKPGKNVITVVAQGPGGDSTPAKITVTRK